MNQSLPRSKEFQAKGDQSSIIVVFSLMVQCVSVEYIVNTASTWIHFFKDDTSNQFWILSKKIISYRKHVIRWKLEIANHLCKINKTQLSKFFSLLFSDFNILNLDVVFQNKCINHETKLGYINYIDHSFMYSSILLFPVHLYSSQKGFQLNMIKRTY